MAEDTPITPANPATPAAPVTPQVDTKALEAAAAERARKELLESLGVKDPEEIKALQAEKKASEEAKLSEAQKQAKALKEAMEDREKFHSKLEKIQAENKSLKESIASRDLMDAQGVSPKSRVMVEAQYSAEKASDPKFDEAAFFARLRKDFPSLFGAAPAAPATTSPAPVNGASPGTSTQALPNALAGKPGVSRWQQ